MISQPLTGFSTLTPIQAISPRLKKIDIHPLYVVRFSNRDKRNEIFNQRQKFRENSPSNSNNSNHNNLIPKNVTFRKNLTKYRRFLYGEANKVKNKLRYQFLWTWQGQILMRKDATTKAFKIS